MICAKVRACVPAAWRKKPKMAHIKWVLALQELGVCLCVQGGGTGVRCSTTEFCRTRAARLFLLFN